MHATHLLTTLLTLLSAAAPATAVEYWKKCRCMTKVIDGVGTGSANDAATEAACNFYRDGHASVGNWGYEAGWCVMKPPYGQVQLTGSKINGDDWWNTCRGDQVHDPNSQAGQCL